ncbi:coenzyme PQQ synthesis protein D (PqqD) [Lachnotalea glycerini]|jgi:hypothetical protein|uniref:Coenzyme PQQ synthesis protein D (PqqD) n=1 Tax=Lachnotalea glycerini TaxID=1763509 RepID=A0A318EK27_9FIRM|nr:PqqD family peptide modification chaperone [Lachnotalea glycerini]PXV86710.1 coenzyme PQQ synthesis protein D (PqqD) [Lachnotalea glycerini]
MNIKYLLSIIMCKVNIIPDFPPRVKLIDNIISDDALQYETKLNSTALAVFKLVDGKNNLLDIVKDMNFQYGCKDDRVLNDVNQLILDANKRNILNLKIESNNLLYKNIARLIFNILYRRVERYDILDSNFFMIFVQLCKIIISKLKGLVIILDLAILFILYLSYDFNQTIYEYAWNIFAYVNLFIIGTVTSISMHETLHAYYFRKISNQTKSGFFVIRGMMMSFKRRKDQQISGLWVELSGPFITFVIGAAGYVSTYFLIPKEFYLYFYIFFFSYLIQIVNLLPFSGDGKNILLRILFSK